MTKKVKKEYEIKTDMYLMVLNEKPPYRPNPVYMKVLRGDVLILDIERTIRRNSSGRLSVCYECSLIPKKDKSIKFHCNGIFTPLYGQYTLSDEPDTFATSVIRSVLIERSQENRGNRVTISTYNYIYSEIEVAVKNMDAELLDKSDKIFELFKTHSENYKILMQKVGKQQGEVVSI